MSRKGRKNFSPFFARSKTSQKKGAKKAVWSWASALSFLTVLRAPLLALGLYVFLWEASVFSFDIIALHLAALVLWGLWVFRAVRYAGSYRTACLFFVPIALLVAGGSIWEIGRSAPVKVWVTPPPYASLPSESLPKARAFRSPVPLLEGSQIHISWQGESKPLSLRLNGKKVAMDLANPEEATTLSLPVTGMPRRYDVVLQSGWRRLGLWRVETKVDRPPSLSFATEPSVSLRKTVKFTYQASDDYGVKTVLARVKPLAASSSSEKKEAIEVPLSLLTSNGGKVTSYADLTFLPWAGQPVSVQLVAVDGAGGKGWSAPKEVTLPSRVFYNPFARALIEERTKLLSQPDRPVREEVANIMAGIARQQGVSKGDPAVTLSLRAGAVRLIMNQEEATLPAVASILWQAAMRLEEGAVGLARQELSLAQQNLANALARSPDPMESRVFFARLGQRFLAYLRALEEDRARQPSIFAAVEWPLIPGQENISPEDFQNQIVKVADQTVTGQKEAAGDSLSLLADWIENLRTRPPELSPAQAKMAEYMVVLRTLARGQKEVIDELAAFKEKEIPADQKEKMLAQQSFLLSALQGAFTQPSVWQAMEEIKVIESAMQQAAQAMKGNNLQEVHARQAQALALLQNMMLALAEQIRQSMTAKGPDEKGSAP